MNKLLYIAFSITGICMACSTTKLDFSQFELSKLSKNGFKVLLDSQPIDLEYTYLNDENIMDVIRNKSAKRIDITRKNKNTQFISFDEVLRQKHYNSRFDIVTINNLVVDSADTAKIKFEEGSIKYSRLLTQKDYSGKDFDDLPQVKKIVGNGILIIETRTAFSDHY